MCESSDFIQYLDFYLQNELFLDMFVNRKSMAALHSLTQPSSLVLYFRFKDTIVNAKYGGHTEAVRRLLGQLPISAQSYSGSPYLDLSLFSYDDKWVSVMERPKTCGDHPIRYTPPLRCALPAAEHGPLSLPLLGHHFTDCPPVLTG